MDDALRLKIAQLKDALSDFSSSLSLDLVSMKDEVLLDTVRNGQVQKFEMVTELLWKTMKKYLWEINGVDAHSPKTVIKAWLENGYCSYEHYETLIDCINKRNKLSHLYNSSEFLAIHKTLDKLLPIMETQLEIMN